MARSNFEASLSLVLLHEGGWADDRRDPGGSTMRGITLATYSEFLGRKATKAELKAIPDRQVEAIYFARYWDPTRCDDLPNGVDYTLFDAAVNSGPARAAKWLQRAVGAVVDGQIGSQTLAATARLPADKVVNAVCDLRLAFMMEAKDSRGRQLWPTFGRGWSTRVAGVRKHALMMASPGP